MPIYEFRCDDCGKVHEVLMKMSDPNPAQCPHCSGPVHKIMSQTTFALKGSGWYATDYKPNPTPPPCEGGGCGGDPAACPAAAVAGETSECV